MNHYGVMASRHWARWLPSRYAEIPDKERFFTDLGEQIEGTITDRAEALEGEDLPDESFTAKYARLNTARTQAESEVLREMLPPPEEDQEAN